MDIRQLETFVKVAEYRSFTKAADMLFVTQPTVSNHVSSLEKELDTVLFYRSRKAVSLTKSGKLLYQHALSILDATRNLTSDLKTFNGNMDGHLNIYASSVPRKFIVPKLVSSFSKEYPAVDYALINDDSQSVIESMLIGETDFGFVGMKEASPKLVYHKIMVDELVFITHYNLGDIDSININDVLKHKLILREEGSGTRDSFEKKLADNNFSLDLKNVIAIVEDPSTIIEMVKEGFASSIISIHEVSNINLENSIYIYSISGLDLSREFYFVYNKDMQYVPVNKTFRSFVLDTISSQEFMDQK